MVGALPGHQATPPLSTRGSGTRRKKRPMKLHHVIEAQQFDVPTLLQLFAVAERMEQVAARGGITDYQNRIMATLFYEPSTRTRSKRPSSAIASTRGRASVIGRRK